MPWGKGKINVGGKLAVSTMDPGVERAGGHYESHGLEHRLRRPPSCERPSTSPHTKATTCAFLPRT